MKKIKWTKEHQCIFEIFCKSLMGFYNMGLLSHDEQQRIISKIQVRINKKAV